MRTLVILASFVAVASLAAPREAAADCNCVAVAGEVGDGIRGAVARADGLYARGDFEGALALYAQAYAADGSATALLYAQAMAEWQLGRADDARAHFAAYIAAGGDAGAELKGRAQAAVSAIDSGVDRGVGELRGGVGAAGGAVLGAGGAVVATGGELRDGVPAPKPKKIAKGAAIVLGLVAVVAVGAVAVHGISAKARDTIEFDKRFGLGMGVGALATGGSAVYLWGLTTATGAAAAASGGVPCVGDAGGGTAIGAGWATTF